MLEEVGFIRKIAVRETELGKCIDSEAEVKSQGWVGNIIKCMEAGNTVGMDE